MVIRDSVLGRSLFWFTASTWLLFAVLCARFGDRVTSKQWTYLMSVPGHKWLWAIAFGLGSVTVMAGLLKRWHILTATGLFVVATFSPLS